MIIVRIKALFGFLEQPSASLRIQSSHDFREGKAEKGDTSDARSRYVTGVTRVTGYSIID
jgi:hypothetical protein